MLAPKNTSNNQLRFLALRTISSSGNALNSLVAPLLTYKVFGSQALMGAAFAIEFLPRVLSALYSGEVVNRFGAHRTYVFSELLRSLAFLSMCVASYYSGHNFKLSVLFLLMALPLLQTGSGLIETVSEESAGFATGSESVGQTICRMSDKFSRIFVMPSLGFLVYWTKDTTLPTLLGSLMMGFSLFFSSRQGAIIYQPAYRSAISIRSTLKRVWQRKDQFYPTLALTFLTIPMAMQWSIVPVYLGMDPTDPLSYRDFSFFAAIEALIVIFGVSTLLNKPYISRKVTWSFLILTYFLSMNLCLVQMDRVLLAASHICWVMSVVCLGVLVRVERQEQLSGTDKADFAGVLGAMEQTGFVIGGLAIAIFTKPNFYLYTIPFVCGLLIVLKMLKGEFLEDPHTN